MIPKSAKRFSEKIMLKQKDDPEKCEAPHRRGETCGAAAR
jgi:hypothetical protein